MTNSFYKHDHTVGMGRIGWLTLLQRVLISMVLLIMVLAVLPGLLRIGGFEVVSVSGGSMGQAVPDKSIVITRLADGDSLRVDDVVVFAAGWLEEGIEQTNVVHRLSLIVPTPEGRVGYTTGDANMITDPEPLSLQGEVSLVKTVVPFVGMFYTVPSKMIFFVVTGMLLTVILSHRPKYSRPDPTSVVQLNEHELAIA